MDLLNYDFQGWPVYARTLRELLFGIGCTANEDGSVTITDQELLDAYPLVLSDDGMGYGIEVGYVTDIYRDTYEANDGEIKRIFNIFTDKREKFSPNS